MMRWKKVCLSACIVMTCAFGQTAFSAPLETGKTNTASSAAATTAFGLVTNFVQNKYADMLGVIPTAITNLNLYSFIDKWYGVRYKWGGTTMKGIDCSAFVQKMYQNVFKTQILRTALLQFGMCKLESDTAGLHEGDLVFFKTKGNYISHVGVYLRNNYFVHSSSTLGVGISNLSNSYWSRVYAGAGKIASLTGSI